MSDEDLVEEIAMNPYLQYFLGVPEYNKICPFASAMFVRFRKWVTPEMPVWINDRICEQPEKDPDDRQDRDDNDGSGSDHKGESDGDCEEPQAENEYNSHSKKRRKKYKDHRNAVKAQLQFVRRDLGYIDSILIHHPDCLTFLPLWLQERLPLIRTLYSQQQGMYDNTVHSCPDRIVSLKQTWVRLIVRGKPFDENPFEMQRKVI